MKKDFNIPTYPLETVKELVKGGAWKPTQLAIAKAWSADYVVEDMPRIILRLTSADFVKWVPAYNYPGAFQDEYHYTDADDDLFIKVQIVDEKGERLLRVVDFKRWGSP